MAAFEYGGILYEINLDFAPDDYVYDHMNLKKEKDNE